VEELEQDEEARQLFFKACLLKLGLQVNHSAQPVPSLSPLHLSSQNPSDTQSLLSSWRDIITKSSTEEIVILGQSDTFLIRNPPPSLLQSTKPSTSDTNLPNLSALSLSEDTADLVGDRIVDYDKIVKHIIVHASSTPSYRETPEFNHAIYYTSLSRFTGPRRNPSSFGQHLLYGEVVTSTSTLLEK
jgi:biotin---protein ligase